MKIRILLLAILLLAACSQGDSGEFPDQSTQRTKSDFFYSIQSTKDVSGFSSTTPLLPQHTDEKLRAAVSAAIITPDAGNYPCTRFLGGTGQNRISTGTHDDLEARMILVTQGEEYLILVSLDLVGFILPDSIKVFDALEAYGINRDRIIISSTHTHEAPDTLGIWGANFYTTGRCPQYIDFLVDTIVQMVLDISQNLVPVKLYAGQTVINEPGAMHSNVNNDSRFPEVYNDNLTVARFVHGDDQTIATLVNWHSHPEVLISLDEYSSDFPHWTRNAVEDHFGGTCVYISGTVGGLLTPLHIDVPEYTQTGQRVTSLGQQVFIKTNNDIKNWSLGYTVADWAIDALESAQQVGHELFVNSMPVDFPVISPFIVGAMWVGLFDPVELIRNDIAFCGIFGCFRQTIHHVRLGELHFVTLPGEALAETSVGREEFTKDWGSSWGVHVYPPIEGYREHLPPGALVMDIGLANNEMGYILPNGDFEYSTEHPNFYEEIYFFSLRTETILREAIFSLIDQMD